MLHTRSAHHSIFCFFLMNINEINRKTSYDTTSVSQSCPMMGFLRGRMRLTEHRTSLPNLQTKTRGCFVRFFIDTVYCVKGEMKKIVTRPVGPKVFSCLDAEAVLACRVVCRDWGASVRTYKPLRTHIRETLVNDCVIEGKVNILEVKLSLGIVRNLDQRLFLAVNFGQVEAARLLIKFGANVNARNKNFLTVLHQAVNLGREEMSKLLVKNGARVNDVCHSHVSVHANVQGPRSATALHFAAKLGQVNIVRFLIEQGATINSKDRGYMTPLHYAAKLGQVGVAMV